MLNKVERYISDNHLLLPEAKYLVGVSGGADSVCLLRILLKLGYHIEAAHCNFMLRGNESLRDEQFVVQLCRQLDIPLHIAHFDTRTYAHQHSISVEMAARDLRYNYFRQLTADLRLQGVCVAHHADDAVETLLMNLIRGTGLHGLTGIRPRHLGVSRPLLCVSRAEIISYLDSIGQDYITDSSNLVPDVVRNKIRLQVLPLLRQINPMVSANLSLTAYHLSEAEKVYNSAMESAKHRLLQPEGISISELLKEPSPECALFEILRPLQFAPDVIAQVYDSLFHPATGRRFLSPSYEAVIDRGRLVIESLKEQPQPSCLQIPEPGYYVYNDQSALRVAVSDGPAIVKSAQKAGLDACKVSFPLTLRPWKHGDRFIPFGMKGSRLVSDYLTDRKLSAFQKRRQLVVSDSTGTIVWLVGHRVDHRFAVGPDTTQTLLVELNPYQH